MRKQRTKVKRISKKTNYKIGRNFEYRVKRHYEKQGYYVVRSYASKGAADLYCMRPYRCSATSVQHGHCYHCCSNSSELLLIQCKNYKGKLKEYEVKALQAMAELTGGIPMHVWKDKQRKLNFVQI